MSQNLSLATISIIIPTLNEAGNIQQVITNIQSRTNIEIIVVDGGSQDDTVALAESLGVKVISSFPSRAIQMNEGAAIANGNILLFLHADTRLPVGFDAIIRPVLQQPGVVAGAFTLRIDGSGLALRLVELGVRWRSHFLQMPYGDQAIFMTKPIFQEIGAFPELPIMEDFELMRRLKHIGKIAIMPASVVTSARRWVQKGVVKTTLINQIVIIAYLLGVAPERIRTWYRQGKF